MVVDTLKNIEIYKGLSPDIHAGLKFLAKAKSNIELGVYPINNNVKAIVSSYETVDEFVRGYESHKNVIDIQSNYWFRKGQMVSNRRNGN